MTNLAFDTHTAVKRLITAGMPDEQAESIVETLRESREFDVSHLATKMDLKNVNVALDKKIDNVAATLDKKIDKVEAGLKADIATLDKKIDKVEAGLKADIAGLKTDMATLENRLTLRLGGMLVASVAIMAALVRFLQYTPPPA